MTDDFVIKQETLPVRCEVCHQADFFEPLSNHCSRCFLVIERYREDFKSLRRNSFFSKRQGCAFLGAIYGLIFGGLGLFWSFLSVFGFNSSVGLICFLICLFTVSASILILVGFGMVWSFWRMKSWFESTKNQKMLT